MSNQQFDRFSQDGLSASPPKALPAQLIAPIHNLSHHSRGWPRARSRFIQRRPPWSCPQERAIARYHAPPSLDRQNYFLEACLHADNCSSSVALSVCLECRISAHRLPTPPQSGRAVAPVPQFFSQNLSSLHPSTVIARLLGHSQTLTPPA